MYNALNEKKLPFIFIVIDNFDIVKDEMHELESEFIQLSRDGQSLGIYFLITATRVNAVRQSLMNNLKTKVVHYLMDQGEAYSIIGRPKFSLEPIPGRVIINKEELYFAQMFLPVEGENDLELFEHLKEEIQLLHDRFESAEKPKPVPMLPDKLTIWELESRLEEQKQPYDIPVGLDEESVAPVYFDLKKNKHCLIIGQTRWGKTNVTKLMLDQLLATRPEKLAVFDSIDRGLSHYAKEENIDYLETKDDITEWAEEIDRLFKVREEMYVEAVRRGETDQLSFPQIVLVIDGITRFQQTIDPRLQDQLADFMKSYAHLGFSLIASGNHTEFSKGYDALTNEIKQVRHAMLLMKKSEQNIIPLPYARQEPDIQPGFGYLVENGKEKKIQVPLCAVERKSVQWQSKEKAPSKSYRPWYWFLFCLALFFHLIGDDPAKQKKNATRNIAVVNEDMGASESENTARFGQDVVAALSERPDYTWTVVNRSAAENGLKNRKYDAVLYIPSDFSKNVLSYDKDHPEKASIQFSIQDQLNSVNKEKVQRELENAQKKMNEQMSTLYWSFVSQEIGNVREEFEHIVGKEVEFQNTMYNFYKPNSNKLSDAVQQREETNRRIKKCDDRLTEAV